MSVVHVRKRWLLVLTMWNIQSYCMHYNHSVVHSTCKLLSLCCNWKTSRIALCCIEQLFLQKTHPPAVTIESTFCCFITQDLEWYQGLILHITQFKGQACRVGESLGIHTGMATRCTTRATVCTLTHLTLTFPLTYRGGLLNIPTLMHVVVRG